MRELNEGTVAVIHTIAENCVHLYVRNILTVETLKGQILEEWKEGQRSDRQFVQKVIMRIATRLCSQALYVAWRSSDHSLRDRAFDNLRTYLEKSLQRTRYARLLQNDAHTKEDILHQTLECLHLALTQESEPGPDDPAAFLQWTRTILFRNAWACIQTAKRRNFVSLDEHAEHLAHQYVASGADPLERVVLQERQSVLIAIISSLRNRRHRQVLVCTFLRGLDDAEIAFQLQASLQQVYQWRHRALKALRRRPEMIQLLLSLLSE